MPARARRSFDNYPTPQPLANAICTWLRDDAELADVDWIIEPSAGSGNFIRAARATWPKARITAVDIRDTRGLCRAAGADEAFCEDWIRWSSRQRPPKKGRVLLLGNLPFLVAELHARAALRLAGDRGATAFLLRLSFLGAEERLDFWKRHPLAALKPITPRPSYDGHGQDGSEYAIFNWGVPAGVYGPLTWEKPPNREIASANAAAAVGTLMPEAVLLAIARVDQELHLARERADVVRRELADYLRPRKSAPAFVNAQSVIAKLRRELLELEQRIRSARFRALDLRMRSSRPGPVLADSAEQLPLLSA